jgi:hypothetical protein
MRRFAKEWALRLGLLTTSLLVALVLAEGTVRIFFPINDGRSNVTLKGEPIKEWFEPGSVYRQVSNEYDAITTITDKGHRVPGVEGSPDVVFLGDSFTYGYGLKDEETFPSIYAARLGRACVNLGMPSSGTGKQLRRLEQFLDRWHWRPKEVKLFFFGMSSSMSAGNDFVDNYNYGLWLRAQAAGVATPVAAARPIRRADAAGDLAGRIVDSRSFLFEHSHLMRRVKYNWGPLLKSVLLKDPGQERMAEALEYTRQTLKELDDLSRRAGFEYNIYLLVPVQDIIRGTFPDTLAAINHVSPKPVIPTAQLFVASPQDFYYSYDGHLNPKGSRRVADFLVSSDERSN